MTIGARQRPRFLCLHGFRTSGEIMRTQVLGKWQDHVTSRLDLFFADAPFPAEGKSDVEGIFPPPYYEWFQFDSVRLPPTLPSPPSLSSSFLIFFSFSKKKEIFGVQELRRVPGVHRGADDQTRAVRWADGLFSGKCFLFYIYFKLFLFALILTDGGFGMIGGDSFCRVAGPAIEGRWRVIFGISRGYCIGRLNLFYFLFE